MLPHIVYIVVLCVLALSIYLLLLKLKSGLVLWFKEFASGLRILDIIVTNCVKMSTKQSFVLGCLDFTEFSLQKS